MKRLLFSLLLLLLASQADAASTWWLRPSGGTTGTCAQAKGASDPGFYLRTFAALNACSGPAFVGGDTVKLKAGTYTEFMGMSSGFTVPSGSIGAPTVLEAVGTEVVVFTAAGGTSLGAFGFNSKSYISLLGDTQARNFKIDMNSASCQSAIQLNFSTNIVMRGLDIGHCNSGNGISIFFSSNSNTLQYSRIHHNGGVQVGVEQSHGLYLATSSNLIDNLEIDNNSGYGFHCNDSGVSQNNVIRNLNIHHNGTTTAAGLLTCNGSGNVYSNSIIWANTGNRGIQVFSGSGSSTIYNMTLYNNRGREIDIGSGSSGTVIRNTIVSNSIGSIMILDSGSGTTFSNNFCTAAGTGCAASGDPLFIDAANGNFHLQTGSPVKTGGATIGPTTDYDNVARPQGVTYSRGAFEFVGVAPPPAELVLQLSADNVATDSSGKANHGTLTGGATYGTGKYNTGFSLNGTTAYVSVADHSTLDLVQFTLEAWVNPTVVDATDRVIIAKSGSYFLYATSSSPTCSSGIRAGFINASGVQSVCYGIPLTAGVLTHVAVTYDGVTLLLYINGSPVTSQAAGGTIVSNSSVVAIGANGTGGEFLQGGIDEPQIHSYARSPAQIITDMTTPVNPVIPPAAASGVKIGSGSNALRCGTGAGACKFGLGS